ncbi:PilZ domain-containing protein [Halobacteriovorax sp. JY17]|uniref:PilZ domain-containing protein n=1 Tax=Halobacteriovorax sp. JY17 TaxID=2014617 RepID=UPI000C5B8C2C|nr:PilZ domain-containing protein [Halobacteriovorax sp. JY17]PIK15550.1 MAG: hypothetical protein CES88_02175 [Halobacteriovorax sp. JY17]
MDRHLNLIKTDFEQTEKRIFPRFPFNYLTFKNSGNEQFVFEIKDISFTGMQLSLKDGGHSFTSDSDISGILHWQKASLEATGKVKWVSGKRIGVEFHVDDSFDSRVREFLSIDNMIDSLRPIHEFSAGVEMPANLKYWLRADGPFEVFVWRHNDGELARFQFLMMERFVEWEDGVGVKTGRILSKRDLDTPLFTEDELVFSVDEGVNSDAINFAQDILDNIGPEFLPEEARDFLKMKLNS